MTLEIIFLGYLNNEHSRRGQNYVDNENPISKFNCCKFLQYSIPTIDNNSDECNNLVWTCIYHIRRERILSSCDCINEEGEYFFLFGNAIHHRYNYRTKLNVETGYIRNDLKLCENQYDVKFKQIVSKNLIEYINNNWNDCVEEIFTNYSDDSTDSEEKIDQIPKKYFQLSDAIKIVSVLRYSLCEQSFYCSCGKHKESFWLIFGLCSLEANCGKKDLIPFEP